jgi:hypothetical protein
MGIDGNGSSFYFFLVLSNSFHSFLVSFSLVGPKGTPVNPNNSIPSTATQKSGASYSSGQMSQGQQQPQQPSTHLQRVPTSVVPKV